MNRVALTLSLIAAFCVCSPAQDRPKAEVFGGYSFERTAPCGTSGGGCNFESQEGPRTANFNGWEGALTGYFSKSWGITADLSGHYGSSGLAFGGGSVSASSYTYMFGPAFAAHTHQVSPFVHGLIGGVSWRSSPELIKYNALGWMIGGGLDVGESQHWAFRLAQVDYQGTRVPGSAKSNIGSGWRYAIGIVFKF